MWVLKIILALYCVLSWGFVYQTIITDKQILKKYHTVYHIFYVITAPLIVPFILWKVYKRAKDRA